jgi:malonyl CoA-acyl carrier protein transacylase
VSRALLACPGRGSYTAASLGSLPAEHPWVSTADRLRGERGLPSLSELDRAERFDPGLHLQPVHASPLTWLVTLLDAERAAADHEFVAVVGNSLGWYSALAVAEVLDFEDGFRLVQEMAILQQEADVADGPGGQLIYPLTDASWQPDPELEQAVAQALAGEGLYASIELGGYAVLAGSESALAAALASLPPARVGERLFPVRLALHGPYHTPLLASVSEAARERLANLSWRAPHLTLVDGRGVRHTPWSASATELAEYTLGQQVTDTYRFAAGVRVVLREYAPELVILPGPGNSLGGIIGQQLVAEGYRGLHNRADFEAAQASEPLVLSMRR